MNTSSATLGPPIFSESCHYYYHHYKKITQHLFNLDIPLCFIALHIIMQMLSTQLFTDITIRPSEQTVTRFDLHLGRLEAHVMHKINNNCMLNLCV
jgi:hypothetical protein